AVLIVSGAMLHGCGTFDDVPRGTTSLLDAFIPQTTPAEAAEMAVDPYSPERRYKGTTLLANAAFGGQPVYLELYLDAIEDDDSGVRAAGVRALGRHGEPEHVPQILELLGDEDRFVRFEAARALQRVHAPDVVPVLLDVIREDREPEADVRAAVAEALGQYPEARVVDGLIAALADRRLAVNHAVRGSLRTLTGQDFGVDRAAWLGWAANTGDLFAGQQPYEYPGFSRAKKPYEYLPFVPAPPSETASTPVGLDPTPGG
ncbi:MAG: HEAT repeat domain-containing protein, partial [Planctomycetota bacterium]